MSIPLLWDVLVLKTCPSHDECLCQIGSFVTHFGHAVVRQVDKLTDLVLFVDD